MAPAATTYQAKLTSPQVFLWRMSLFLILAILLAIIVDGQTQQLRKSFLANPGLNALIIGVLLGRHRLRLPPSVAPLPRDQMGQQFPHLRSGSRG